MIKALANQAVSEMSVSVDEPVTADVKRLICLPGSLHGGSGNACDCAFYFRVGNF